jgi:GPH family glycoside/pentoside/hexuronide:cation symporter
MWVYGIPQVARDPVIVFVTVYSLIFYEAMGASLAIIGFFIALARGFDILNDPIIAHLSDNTVSRFGKRYPWILAGFVFYAISFFCFWAPPAVEGIEAWFAVFYILLWFGASIVFIPYSAMAPELTYDQRKRQDLYAYGATIENIAYIVLTFFPGILVFIIKAQLEDCGGGCALVA